MRPVRLVHYKGYASFLAGPCRRTHVRAGALVSRRHNEHCRNLILSRLSGRRGNDPRWVKLSGIHLCLARRGLARLGLAVARVLCAQPAITTVKCRRSRYISMYKPYSCREKLQHAKRKNCVKQQQQPKQAVFISYAQNIASYTNQHKGNFGAVETMQQNAQTKNTCTRTRQKSIFTSPPSPNHASRPDNLFPQGHQINGQKDTNSTHPYTLLPAPSPPCPWSPTTLVHLFYKPRLRVLLVRLPTPPC